MNIITIRNVFATHLIHPLKRKRVCSNKTKSLYLFNSKTYGDNVYEDIFLKVRVVFTKQPQFKETVG